MCGASARPATANAKAAAMMQEVNRSARVIIPCSTLILRSDAQLKLRALLSIVRFTAASREPRAASCDLRAAKLWPRQILAIELLLPVVEPDVPAVDEDVGDRRADLERIAFRDEQVGILTWFEAAHTIGDSEDLRRVDRQRLERFV